MSKLGVNIDHVATLRQARKISYPDPVKAALICERSGADSIVCHLREDRRHIQDSDLIRLKKNLSGKLNLEMAMSEEIVKIAVKIKPDQATIVPEKRMELTTEGGLNIISQKRRLQKIVKRLTDAGIAVSVFIEPDRRQIQLCPEIGVYMVELHTGRYANAANKETLKRECDILNKSSGLARSLGIKVFAGHGLNYENVKPMMAIKEIEEYNIGHSIVARAVFTGLKNAVREMKGLLK